MATTQILLIIFVSTFLITFALVFFGQKKQTQESPTIYSIYSPNGLLFVHHLEKLWNNNDFIKPYSTISTYENMFGKLPESSNPLDKIDLFYDAVGLSDFANIPEGTLKSFAADYLSNLEFDLSERYRLQFQKLQALSPEETLAKYNLHIHENEVLHYAVQKGVDWLEEKTITTSYGYSGYRFRSGGEFSYTFGTLNVLKDTKELFVNIDRGALYITNSRIIFVGLEKMQNKSIPFSNILEYTLFKNGILIGKENGRKPLIQFAEYVKNAKDPIKRDELNNVIRVINRVINKTQLQELIEEEV